MAIKKFPSLAITDKGPSPDTEHRILVISDSVSGATMRLLYRSRIDTSTSGFAPAVIVSKFASMYEVPAQYSAGLTRSVCDAVSEGAVIVSVYKPLTVTL